MIQYPEIETNDGSIVCSFPDGEFKNTKFTIGKVSLVELDNESLSLKFEYNIIENYPKKNRIKYFESCIGDYLNNEINNRINSENPLIYLGGEGLTDGDLDYSDGEDIED